MRLLIVLLFMTSCVTREERAYFYEEINVYSMKHTREYGWIIVENNGDYWSQYKIKDTTGIRVGKLNKIPTWNLSQ